MRTRPALRFAPRSPAGGFGRSAQARRGHCRERRADSRSDRGWRGHVEAVHGRGTAGRLPPAARRPARTPPPTGRDGGARLRARQARATVPRVQARSPAPPRRRPPLPRGRRHSWHLPRPAPGAAPPPRRRARAGAAGPARRVAGSRPRARRRAAPAPSDGGAPADAARRSPRKRRRAVARAGTPRRRRPPPSARTGAPPSLHPRDLQGEGGRVLRPRSAAPPLRRSPRGSELRWAGERPLPAPIRARWAPRPPGPGRALARSRPRVARCLRRAPRRA